jgi:hypothetical protein
MVDPASKKATPEKIRELKDELESKAAVLEAMKAAFYNRVPFNGTVPEYQDLHRAALAVVGADHALQKCVFGKIRVRVSAVELLRN